MDSHAGSGLYDLTATGDVAAGAWTQGIGRLWQATDAPDACGDYLTCIRELNPDGVLRYYPGSPEVARRLTGPHDSLVLCENQPEVGALLRDNYRGDRRVTAVLADGWQVLGARPATPTGHVLLVDPPYRSADDPERAVALMRDAVRAAPDAVVAVWYPIEHGLDLTAFHRSLRDSHPARLHCAELRVQPVAAGRWLSGSGLAVANAPKAVIDELAELLPWLAALLDQGDAGWSLRAVPG
ncbi:23S rRNA (adenine(2030)-N(6))-methyltransferase RlmJ [Dactylosporangium cerinum]